MKKKISKKHILDKKLKEYGKILQKDEDWDWSYILRILRYKLARTRKCISSNNIIKDASKVARQIREVEILLERVERDDYYWEISKNFRKKYGSPKMITGKRQPGSLTVPVTIKYTKETLQNSKHLRKENSRLHKRATRMQNTDLKKAFNLMHKNIWGWWD